LRLFKIMTDRKSQTRNFGLERYKDSKYIQYRNIIIPDITFAFKKI